MTSRHDGMAQELVINRFLFDIAPLASGAMTEEEIIGSFSKSVSGIFGIDKVSFNYINRGKEQQQQNTLEDYIRNTKKTYIDNQLSQYSSFSELINYSNQGFRSCAIMPLVAEGKVVSLLEMLSSSENKFSDELVRSVSFGASFVGFVLMYKSELGRSLRLATYFDAAFSNSFPQFIIDGGGSVVKLNKYAMRSFGATGADAQKITDFLPIEMGKVNSLTTGVYTDLVLGRGAALGRAYEVSASRINEKLVHVAARDATEDVAYESVSEMISRSRDVVIVTTGADFKITDASPNSERMFGYARGILTAGNLLDIISEQERNDFKGMLAQQLSSADQAAQGSVNLIFSESTSRYMHFVCRRHMGGYIFMLVDAGIERYVDSAKRDLNDFISSTSDVVLSVDSAGCIIDCNMPAERILGIRRDALVGKEVRSIYADPGILGRDMQFARNNVKIDNTYVDILSHKDGSEVGIPATHSIRLFNSSKADTGEVFLIIIKELQTKRSMADLEKGLVDKVNEAKKFKSESQLKSQFIYNVSHELKTPLTNIKGFSRLLYDEEFGPLNGEQKEYIKTTLDEVDRLTLVIQQILDAAKLDAGKVDLDYKEVDFNVMGNNPSIKALEESCRNKGLEFKWEVGFDVPRVQADPNRLIQVFVNLIGNAIKFTEKGGITVRMARKSRTKVLCSVIDTGAGIGDEDKKRLFRRKFYQAVQRPMVQHPGAGTGLGLSISRDIVGLHGGKISFESELGKGSTFWFILPIHPNRQKRRVQAQPAAPAAPHGEQRAQPGEDEAQDGDGQPEEDEKEEVGE